MRQPQAMSSDPEPSQRCLGDRMFLLFVAHYICQCCRHKARRNHIYGDAAAAHLSGKALGQPIIPALLAA